MRGLRPFLVAGALIGAAAPAWAFNEPGFSTPAPIEHVQEMRYADAQPTAYAMNYADDAARTLGLRDGRWQAYDPGTSSTLVPSVNGGIDSGRPMLHLQWR